MWLLILGLALFLGAHFFTTLRGTRAAVIGRLGEGGYKGIYTLVSAAGLILIFIGFGSYRSTGYVVVWHPPYSLFHPIALVLLWFAFVALTATYAPPSRIKSLLRHPMLVAVKAWALSHLLVNGDLGSMLLFGSLLAWAIYDRIALKRRGDTGAPPAGWSINDLLVVALGTVAYVAMFWLHDSLIGVAAA
ncbi:MAG: NnrU family protein [Reyranella sp.]|uniref:NnrU family protein n=1 Tax=Reyranella sp. TaxID=1929291 RepID=UPI0011FBD5B4|nr:NnrU family protein [Reyranella sp.]TAJ94955.1 MAG: NnrU family protein [Reyranella sp.]TBR29393.1 MAG: NnrU family protein [Reyranella sp.]